MKNKKTKSKKMKRFYHTMQVLLLSCLLLGIVYGGVELTLAFLNKKSGLTNTFAMGTTEIVIDESFNGTIKSDVKIKNNGNVPVYVRAEIVAYWKDSEGNILLEKPVRGKTGETEVDYILTSPVSGDNGGWETKSPDEFVYYTVPVEPGDSTLCLAQRCEEVKEYKDGRVLVVDIIAQSIQATPAETVEEAWGVSINRTTGVLTPPAEVTE